MSHIDFTRWKPNEPPTAHEIIKIVETADPAAAETVRRMENLTLDMFCCHAITIPDPLQRKGERYCIGFNIDWDNPSHSDGEHLGICALQVTFEDLLNTGNRVVETFINPRWLSREEALTFAHLLTIGVYPRPAGKEWVPVIETEGVSAAQSDFQSGDHHE